MILYMWCAFFLIFALYNRLFHPPKSHKQNATNHFKIETKALIVSLSTCWQRKKKFIEKNWIDEELVLNEPLALSSNECGNYVAIFTCWRFSILFYIIVALLAYGCCAAFAVIQMNVWMLCSNSSFNENKEMNYFFLSFDKWCWG